MTPLRSIIETSVSALPTLATTHSQLIKLGTIGDTFAANNLLGGYLKSRELRIALKLFDEIPQKDTVSWNSLIAGYVNYGDLESAWEVLICMKRCGFFFDGYTFGCILKGVASNDCLFAGQQVHGNIVKMGYEENVYSGSALLDMYAKCGRVVDAHKCFNCMPDRNSVSWNALISGYVETDDHVNSFWLFKSMHREGVRLDDGTFSPLLTLFDSPDFYKLTMQVHCTIIKHGMASDSSVLNATISAYSECGSIKDAKGVFDGAGGERDIVSWNAMLAACLEHDKRDLAFNLFTEMQILGFQPDIYTYTSMISSCFEEEVQNQGQSLHALVIKRGVEHLTPISNSLMAMFTGSTSSHMEYAITIFENLEFKDQVSWNSMLTGFSQHGFSENALKLFQIMQSGNVGMDYYAFSAVLRSCADMATLQLGQQIHALAIRSGFESNEFVTSSLVVMYSKCGIIADAARSFETSHKLNSVTWNSIMFAYAQDGQGHVVLKLFCQMRKTKVKLDHITFVAVLTACSHIGLVEEGYYFLKHMESDYGISPRMEHYACVIDLLGRAGHLKEAESLVRAMPFQPNAMVWKTLLGACRLCGDVELALEVANLLLESEPYEHCTYVLLCDLYGHLRRWDEIAVLKRTMKEKGVKKVPGWSWIEVQNQLHAFKADDHSHTRNEDIHQMLRRLTDDIAHLEISYDWGNSMDD
ncbi:putative pentatricopeptide repeat-containing protein At3g25970 [Cynara cardunculus var. scolymus]|uniref:Pentatricopeptide repeat-containing protein n=1 Tax=Cynara cardunculus var. scolymus TaxID=59895 RepID=A0A103YHW0_CYNCS|nr:putative pentatricopeptide repeat-containing protein At3g25970 [Cynara cardunculus var. scolymus]KVI09419.1 Pentatricopeptide repeat-containing protein [Cynara cardunculus var. scolymus]